MDCLIGLDSGTQSTRAAAIADDGRVLAIAGVPHAVSTPCPGWAEQDAGTWGDAAITALRDLRTQLPDATVHAVGLAFQRETFAVLDPDGTPRRPGLLWLDIRAADEAEELRKLLGAEAFQERTGKPLDITGALPRLLWLRRHEPSCIRPRHRFEDVGAALARALTGRPVTCVAGADTCGLIDLDRRDWDEDLLASVGLARDRMPELAEPGMVVGALAPAAASATGLESGVPVVTAGGDGQVFTVGMGAVAPGQQTLSLGTSIVLGVPTDDRRVSPACRTLIGPATRYLLESVLQSGSYLLNWFADSIAKADVRSRDWEYDFRRVPPGAEGLVTVPNWWGTRFPEDRPDVRGATVGWGNHHTTAHFYRSLLEGLAFEIRRLGSAVEPLQAFTGAPRVGGGGAASSGWREILADVLGEQLLLSPRREPVCLGAAILAGVGIGRWPDLDAAVDALACLEGSTEPIAEHTETYDRLYREIYLPLHAHSATLCERLTRLMRHNTD